MFRLEKRHVQYLMQALVGIMLINAFFFNSFFIHLLVFTALPILGFYLVRFHQQEKDSQE